jgi:hypothetical protein
LGDVAPEREGPATKPFDLFDRGVQSLAGSQVKASYGCACFCQTQGDALANAAPGAGDKSNCSFKAK